MAISLLAIPVTALIVNEFESNPAGTDSGNEWIELYTENPINLTELIIINNDGDNITLTNLSFQDYYIVNFSSQFLDNVNESITLKSGNQTLDQTPIFKDDKDDGLTWQYCSWNWTQREETQGASNNCTITTPPPSNTTNQTSQNITTSDDNDTEEDETEQFVPSFIPAPSTSTSTTQQNETVKKIVLNAPSKKSAKKESFLSTKEQTRIFLLLSFTFLTVVIIILLALRKL